jgi:hypothetical protein
MAGMVSPDSYPNPGEVKTIHPALLRREDHSRSVAFHFLK